MATELAIEPLERQRSFTGRDLRRMLAATLLIMLSIVAGGATDFVPTGPVYTLGALAPTPILSTKNKVIENPVETDQKRAAEAQAVAPQYDYTPEKAGETARQQTNELRAQLVPVDAAFAPSIAPEARQIQLKAALPDLPAAPKATLLALPVGRWETVKQAAIGVLDSSERDQIRDSDVATARATLPAEYMPTGLSDAEEVLVTALVAPLLIANSTYSEELTASARQVAASKVQPVMDTVQVGQVIVDQGHPITESDMVKIRALGLDATQFDWGRQAAWLLLSLVIVTLLLVWVWLFRPEYWHRNRTLWLIGLLFVVTAFVVKIAAGRPALPFLIPTAASAMLLAALLDAGVGTVLIALLAMLAAAANGSTSLEIAMYVFLGGFAGILAIRKADRLHYFVQAAVAVAATDIAVVSVFTLLGQHDVTGLLQLWAAAGVSAVLAAIITIGSFAVLGNLFGILTGFQLLELANPSQPLLRRLLTETPGTYHHALMVGNLAERAAAAIGADPLLTRVAAYYHDVGKLANPLAFIENQANGENVHDQLEPDVSAAVLKQHVPDGIDLAYRAKLPKPLIAFIPQHHGTALLSFFYAKAREAAAAPFGGFETAAGKAAADAVDQRRFRHAGPKPQSREAALLMLADGVEASVRSLSSRDEASIRAMVRRIIDERVQDGQLDECSLTIRDLERVREAFVQQLLGMYHQRIAYPQNKIVELETRRDRGLG